MATIISLAKDALTYLDEVDQREWDANGMREMRLIFKQVLVSAKKGPENMTCGRCQHRWVSRTIDPVKCPKCKSPYWNKPRRRKIQKR